MSPICGSYLSARETTLAPLLWRQPCLLHRIASLWHRVLISSPFANFQIPYVDIKILLKRGKIPPNSLARSLTSPSQVRTHATHATRPSRDTTPGPSVERFGAASSTRIDANARSSRNCSAWNRGTLFWNSETATRCITPSRVRPWRCWALGL